MRRAYGTAAAGVHSAIFDTGVRRWLIIDDGTGWSIVGGLEGVGGAGEEPGSIAGAADLEGDGVLELFGARDQLWFVRLDELLPMAIPGERMVGDFSTNVGDVNGDGHLDILPGAARSVLLGDGLGGFIEVPGPDPGLFDGALGDLDGDGRDEIVGLRPECPLDSPVEVECSRGYNPASWIRSGDAWSMNVRATLLGHEAGNVLVADLLPGHAPVGVYELYDRGWITLADFGEHASSFAVPEEDESSLVAVRRGGDDRAELVRVSARDGFTWGARMRAGQHHVEVPFQWVVASEYRHVAAGDLDLDGNEDLVLAGEGVRVLLDRAGEPAAVCTIMVPLGELVGDVALADLDGAGAPELIVAVEAGLAVYTVDVTP